MSPGALHAVTTVCKSLSCVGASVLCVLPGADRRPGPKFGVAKIDRKTRLRGGLYYGLQITRRGRNQPIDSPNQTKPNQMWHRSRSHYAPTRQNLVRCASSCPMWLGRLVVYCCIGYQIPLWYKYRAASFHTVCGGYRTG